MKRNTPTIDDLSIDDESPDRFEIEPYCDSLTGSVWLVHDNDHPKKPFAANIQIIDSEENANFYVEMLNDAHLLYQNTARSRVIYGVTDDLEPEFEYRYEKLFGGDGWYFIYRNGKQTEISPFGYEKDAKEFVELLNLGVKEKARLERIKKRRGL